ERERPLVARDDTLPLADGAHVRAGARRSAAAVTGAAGPRGGQAERHGHPAERIPEGQRRAGLEVGPPLGLGPSAAAEQVSEQVAEPTATTAAPEQVVDVEAAAAARIPTRAAAAEQRPRLVVLPALGVVGE